MKIKSKQLIEICICILLIVYIYIIIESNKKVIETNKNIKYYIKILY